MARRRFASMVLVLVVGALFLPIGCEETFEESCRGIEAGDDALDTDEMLRSYGGKLSCTASNPTVCLYFESAISECVGQAKGTRVCFCAFAAEGGEVTAAGYSCDVCKGE